jgi:vacuolar-type H+-ATPase subunit E/Vma4
MSLSDLIGRLEQEAQGRVETIQQHAVAQVAEIEAAGLRAATEVATRYLAEQQARRAVLHQRALVRARRDARARELEARHAQLARILSRAHALVPEMAHSTLYRDALPGHVEEALSYLQGLRPRVRCRAEFASLVQPIVARHEGTELEIDETADPGVIAEAGDGSVVVDNTLAVRLTRIQGHLAIELTKQLLDAASGEASIESGYGPS